MFLSCTLFHYCDVLICDFNLKFNKFGLIIFKNEESIKHKETPISIVENKIFYSLYRKIIKKEMTLF